MKERVHIIFFLLILETSSLAQDLHWSQPSGALLYQNPALTGAAAKFSASLSYRNQWHALNTSYDSYQFSGDYRFGKKESKVMLAAGLLLYQDFAGTGNLRTTNIGTTISSLLRIRHGLKLCVGHGINMVQKSQAQGRYSWGTQYNGTAYDPSLDSQQPQGSNSIFLADLSLGMALVYDRSDGSFTSNSRNKFVLGYSISHYNMPNQSVSGGLDEMERRHTVYAQGVFRANDNLSVKPMLLFYHQLKMNELMAGCLFRYRIGQQSKMTGYKTSSHVAFGISYRYKDAIIPTFELEKDRWLFGLSYDVNVSKLRAVSGLRGGIELSVRVTNSQRYLYNKMR